MRCPTGRPRRISPPPPGRGVVIRALPRGDRRRSRLAARSRWRSFIIPIAILDIEGRGRSLVLMERLETRWSQRQNRRVWRAPSSEGAAL